MGLESEQSSNCTHMLHFTVRGMFPNLEFQYANFTTRRVIADALYPLVREVVQQLEWCGLNDITFSFDGASPNRKFYKMRASSSDGLVQEIHFVKTNTFTLHVTFLTYKDCH